MWNQKVKQIFERLDQAAWDGLGHNPVLLLQSVSETRLLELASNNEFVSKLSEAYEIQRKYLHDKEDTWFHKTYGILNRNHLVAYFSAEFGIAECLHTYSGGLGILSGDHLKSASDLGIPLVGVGLFYKRGYFSQTINHDGWQVETYPENVPNELPIEPVLDQSSNEPLIISVPIEERQVRVRAWQVSVGRVSLVLLDTNLPGLNSKEDCEITAELYGGDVHTRIKQELILGFGGAKILKALGLKPTIYHMNEGHAAFVILERIKEIMEEGPGITFSEAKNLVKQSGLFTTHTPVPAGIDSFENSLLERYIAWYPKKLGIDPRHVLELGHEDEHSHRFNMAVFAIKLSSNVNTVSKLHQQVARKMWSHVFAEIEKSSDIGSTLTQIEPSNKRTDELYSVTNGIHTLSWISNSFAEVYDEYLGREWRDKLESPDIWARVRDIPNDVLWNAHLKQKAHLIESIQARFPIGYGKLDQRSLTIGFARRFATYKRAALFLSDKERLKKLLCNQERPVQFIFAGKAHPRDHEGKKLIQEIINYAKSEDCCARLVFLPDYDISVARLMVSGVDLWLNNPQRPLEACGTSGMKALVNGVLNFSVLDGWWDEAYTRECGWAIGSGQELQNHHEQISEDSKSLYSTLENEIVPEFYLRENDIPKSWLEKMKHSISTLAPRFTTSRMVIEYAERFYFQEEGIADKLNKSEFGVKLLDSLPDNWEPECNL